MFEIMVILIFKIILYIDFLNYFFIPIFFPLFLLGKTQPSSLFPRGGRVPCSTVLPVHRGDEASGRQLLAAAPRRPTRRP